MRFAIQGYHLASRRNEELRDRFQRLLFWTGKTL
jgi:hypothetical protein